MAAKQTRALVRVSKGVTGERLPAPVAECDGGVPAAGLASAKRRGQPSIDRSMALAIA
jgi:hypothetical protein